MVFAARLVPYQPAGNPLPGLLLDAVSWDASLPLNDVAALRLAYPSLAEASALLADPVEIAVEVSAGGAWVEPANARFLSSEITGNAAQPLDVPNFTFRGLGALLERPFVLREADNPGKAYTSDETDPKRNFLSATVGQIVMAVIGESRAKYSSMLSGITLGFSATHDSNGKPWNKLDSVAYGAGTDLLRILDDMTSRGVADWWMQGRELRMVNADSTSQTRDLRLNLVDATEAPVRATFENLATHTIVEGGQGRIWQRTVAGAVVPYGARVERIANDSITTDGTALDLIARKAVHAVSPRREYTRAIAAYTSYPLVDWLVGDWVQAENSSGTYESMRVHELGLTVDPADPEPKTRVTLNDRFMDASVRDAKRLTGIVHGTTQNLGDGGVPSQVDKLVPATPLGLAANSVGYWQGAVPLASVDASWQAVTTSVDGLPLNGIDHYEITLSGQGKRTSELTVGFDRIQPSRIFEVRVRAVSRTGIPGPWASTDVLTAYPLGVLDPPTEPLLRTANGSLAATWDGFLQGDGAPYKPPLHFSHVEVEARRDGVAGWTRYSRDNGWTLTGLTAGDTFHYRLVAVDMRGVESDPGPAADITVTSQAQQALDEAGQAAADSAQAKQDALDAVDAAMQSIVGSTIEYALSTSRTTPPTTGWTTSTVTPSASQVIWTRTRVQYASGVSQTTNPVVWTGPAGPAGEAGAGIEIAGTVASYAGLPSGLGPADAGKAYLNSADGKLYIWDGTQFPANGQGVEFRGPEGEPGTPGVAGPQGVSIVSIVPYYRLSATQPVHPSGAAPSGWNTAEPAPDFSKSLWRSDRVELSNGTYQWTPVVKVSAYTAAGLAMTAADGKSTITYGSVAPESPKSGDRWYNSSTGKTQIWSGSAWRDTAPGEGFIPALDIGRATVGDLEVGRLTAATSQFDSVVVETLVGQDAYLSAIYGNSIIVDAEELAPGPGRFEEAWDLGAGASIVTDANDTSGKSFTLNATSGLASAHGPLMPVRPGQVLYGTVEVVGSLPSNAAFWARFYGSDRTTEIGSGANFASAQAGPGVMAGTVEVPAGAAFVLVRVQQAQASGSRTFRNISVKPQAGPVLIEDGAIVTPKLAALSITGDKIAVGALDAFQITAPLIQSVSQANRGIKWNGNDIVAYTDTGAESFRLSGLDGTVDLTGKLTTGMSGNRVEVSPNINWGNNAGLKLISGGGGGREAALFIADSSGSGGWGAYVTVLAGSETIRDNSGRAELLLHHDSGFWLRNNRGPYDGVGVGNIGNALYLRGRLPQNPSGMDLIMSYRSSNTFGVPANDDIYVDLPYPEPADGGIWRPTVTPHSSSYVTMRAGSLTASNYRLHIHNWANVSAYPGVVVLALRIT